MIRSDYTKFIGIYFNNMHHPVAWDCRQLFANQKKKELLNFKQKQTFILSGTRTQTLELPISHTTWTQTHHLDTTCCSYLSDKILFITYSSPSVMRFVLKVLNFIVWDKCMIIYEYVMLWNIICKMIIIRILFRGRIQIIMLLKDYKSFICFET